jgi:hypothetical protein
MIDGELRYDPETHSYFMGKVRVPSVTQVLDSVGLISPFCKDETAAAFGSNFHLVMTFKLFGKLGSVDQKFIDEGWMEAIDKFFREQNPRPYISPLRGVSRRFFSQRFRYAGELDFVGMINYFKNKVVILDWKTISQASREAIRNCDLQVAGYRQLFQEYESYQGKIPGAMVRFIPRDYRIYELNDPAAWATFHGALAVKRWKEAA